MCKCCSGPTKLHFFDVQLYRSAARAEEKPDRGFLADEHVALWQEV